MATVSDEYVVCPYCSEEHGDCAEWAMEETVRKMNCQQCDSEFEYWAQFDVMFLTNKSE